MRKNILIAIIGLVSVMSQIPVKAQHWVYHNENDTIVTREPIYFHQWSMYDWIDNDPEHNHMLVLRPGYGQGWAPLGREEIVMYCYTNIPINVIGIAGSCESRLVIHDYFYDTTKEPEYLRIYDACVDSFPMKVSVHWQPTDPKRYLKVRQQWNEGCCSNLSPSTEYAPIHEYYFEDKPITLVDSFYVGGTCFSNYSLMDETGIDLRMTTYRFVTDDLVLDCDRCPTINNLYKYRFFDANHDSAWHWVSLNRFLLVFPILEIDSNFVNPPDTTPYNCPSVTGCRPIGFEDHAGYVAWNTNSEHSLYRVSYGPSGIQPDEGTVVETTHNFATLTGLDSCQHYVAYVQGVCNHQDSLYYSPWSDSVSIYACNPQEPEPPDTTTTGVRRPDLLDQMTHLVPNPASDVVQVMSSFRMKSLEVFALNGTRVLEQEADGVTATFSVSGMAPGTYIVQIHTRQGQLITKKLAVVGDR